MALSLSVSGVNKLIKMIVEVPHYWGIILLQLLSSSLAFVGIPMLIPVIELAQEEGRRSETSVMIFDLMGIAGIEVSFYSLTIAVTLLFVFSELIKVASSLLGQYSRLLISTKNRYFYYWSRLCAFQEDHFFWFHRRPPTVFPIIFGNNWVPVRAPRTHQFWP